MVIGQRWVGGIALRVRQRVSSGIHPLVAQRTIHATRLCGECSRGTRANRLGFNTSQCQRRIVHRNAHTLFCCGSTASYMGCGHHLIRGVFGRLNSEGCAGEIGHQNVIFIPLVGHAVFCIRNCLVSIRGGKRNTATLANRIVVGIGADFVQCYHRVVHLHRHRVRAVHRASHSVGCGSGGSRHGIALCMYHLAGRCHRCRRHLVTRNLRQISHRTPAVCQFTAATVLGSSHQGNIITLANSG